MADLFIEIFPVAVTVSPLAYQLHLTTDVPEARLRRLGTRLARRFDKTFPGTWVWLDRHLVTDVERGITELNIAADMAQQEQPKAFALLDSIGADPDWYPSPQTLAEFVLRVHLRNIETEMQTALNQPETRLRNASIEREHKLRAWDVMGTPAISISIASRMIYEGTLQQFAGLERDLPQVREKLARLRVRDIETRRQGDLVEVVGPLAEHRKRLMGLAADPAIQEMLNQSLDGEWVVKVKMGRDEFEYLARMLEIVVRLSQLRRFEVDAKRATYALQMKPADRAQHVRIVSDVAKEAGILANAYNSRTLPDAFFAADFEMNLRFDENRVRPYKPESLTNDFAKCGVYSLRRNFRQVPMRVCVVNTLSLKLEDFVEAMQRHLKRHFDFGIEIIRERQVRVVSRPNLESAVRVVEKEDPDIILAFFPDDIDEDNDEEAELDATDTYIKSLTLGRGIPTQVIYKSTLDDPDAMPAIIMSMLGKTGNSPFVLAEPLEYADFVVGLDVVRETNDSTGETNLTAIARVYRADGAFSHYTLRTLVQQDDSLPFVLVRDLLPQKIFAKQRVVLHHDGHLPQDLLKALSMWGQAIGASFYPVEILRFGAPRIYAIDKGVVQPPWGSAFKLSDTEAFLISALPKEDVTPQPLHVRTVSAAPAGAPPLAIEKALRGILVWTLLAYSAERLPKLPVTVVNAEELTEWLRKGGKFSADEGEVPFWL